MSRVFSLRLVLACSTTGEVSHVQLTLNSLPLHGSDLKKEIEIVHEIPRFCQTLTYGDPKTELGDCEKLNDALVRNGDTVWVTYTAKAECREIERVREYLQKLTDALNDNPPIENEDSLSATILSQAFSGGYAQLLRNDLFMPWKSEIKQMNKEVFTRTNSLHYLIQLLRIVHTRDWDANPQNMKFLEIVILETLHPFAAVMKFRRLLAQEGVVELCLLSLLRTKLERRATFGQDRILPYLIGEAMATLCNMCELHETNVKIGTNPEALEQFICIAHSSHYDIWHAQVTMNMFASLSHTREAHPYLASESVVDGLMNVCEYRSEVGDTRMDVLLLRYYTQLVFNQLILLSPSFLSVAMLERMDHFVSTFLKQVDVLTLSEHEVKSGNFWSVFKPFIRLLYVPNTPLIVTNEHGACLHRRQLVARLQHLSISAALLALHMIILNSEDGHKSLEVIEREHLIPYIVAAPSHVPVSLKTQAMDLVGCLGRYMHIGPPALTDLAKASLAKFHFGLERMLCLESPYELVEEYYPLLI